MAVGSSVRRGGFRRGALAGAAAATVGLLVLALAFPPSPGEPPALAPGAERPPDAPTAPSLADPPATAGALQAEPAPPAAGSGPAPSDQSDATPTSPLLTPPAAPGE